MNPESKERPDLPNFTREEYTALFNAVGSNAPEAAQLLEEKGIVLNQGESVTDRDGRTTIYREVLIDGEMKRMCTEWPGEFGVTLDKEIWFPDEK